MQVPGATAPRRLFFNTRGTNPNGQNITINPPSPSEGDVEIPQHPFNEINGSNPASWYGGISRFMSKLNKAFQAAENKMTDSILGSEDDPNLIRHLKFMVNAVLGKMYDLLKYLTEWTNQNKEAEKDTNPLAFLGQA
jgi:hypothetical protein